MAISSSTSRQIGVARHSTAVASDNAEQTVEMGIRLASKLMPGQVVVLSGCLGVGKTQFAKGLAAGLGVLNPDLLCSPTFDIIHSHRFEQANQTLSLHHIDLYRLDAISADDVAWLDEYWSSDSAITVIEWGERVESILPRPYWRVNITDHKDQENSRRICTEQIVA